MNNVLSLTLASTILFANMANAKGLDAKDFALSVCLGKNYSKITKYETANLKDYSDFNLGWSPEQQIKLIQFVEKEAGHFYKEDLPIHSEVNPPPYNAIFQRCMEFYKSKKLNNFILKNK
jgi:hypothetical protein